MSASSCASNASAVSSMRSGGGEGEASLCPRPSRALVLELDDGHSGHVARCGRGLQHVRRGKRSRADGLRAVERYGLGKLAASGGRQRFLCAHLRQGLCLEAGELPHERGALVLEQIAPLRSQADACPAGEQLTAGGAQAVAGHRASTLL
jgi:hypothetical protein